jgi:hypothetical protein
VNLVMENRLVHDAWIIGLCHPPCCRID